MDAAFPRTQLVDAENLFRHFSYSDFSDLRTISSKLIMNSEKIVEKAL